MALLELDGPPGYLSFNECSYHSLSSAPALARRVYKRPGPKLSAMKHMPAYSVLQPRRSADSVPRLTDSPKVGHTLMEL